VGISKSFCRQMIDQIKCYVKDMPFYRRRKLWREIVQIAELEKYHRRCMEAYRKKKIELISEHERLKNDQANNGWH